MDINMPIMNGYTAVEKIRQLEQDNKLPIMNVISCTTNDDRNNVGFKMFTDYIQKPV